MRPDAIFLDLDDTLISYDGVGPQAWQEVCSVFAERTRSVDSQTLLSKIGELSAEYWSDPVRHTNGRLNLFSTRRHIVRIALEQLGCYSLESCIAIADGYSNLREELVYPFPGTEDTLNTLKDHGVKLALLTNGSSEMQRAKIERFGLGRYFDAILIEGEIGFGKPDPRVYRMALDKLDVSPEDVWMVGDNLVWDIAGSQRLGIYAIWNDYMKKGLPENSSIIPDRIISQVSELL
jgi:putative hydrolase of the HAD superfamily